MTNVRVTSLRPPRVPCVLTFDEYLSLRPHLNAHRLELLPDETSVPLPSGIGLVRPPSPATEHRSDTCGDEPDLFRHHAFREVTRGAGSFRPSPRGGAEPVSRVPSNRPEGTCWPPAGAGSATS